MLINLLHNDTTPISNTFLSYMSLPTIKNKERKTQFHENNKIQININKSFDEKYILNKL